MDGGIEFEWDWFADGASVLDQSRQQATWSLVITASDRLRSTPADSQPQNSMIDEKRNINSLTLEILNAREAERLSIARILHDEVQPLILSARFKLALFHRQMPEGVSLAQEADSLLAQALGACRSLSTELSALELAPDGLIPALEILAELYRCRFNLEISLRLPKQMLRWPSKTEIVLYQSVPRVAAQCSQTRTISENRNHRGRREIFNHHPSPRLGNWVRLQ